MIWRKKNCVHNFSVKLQVLESDGLDRTRSLAREHCDLALNAIESLTESKYKWALASLTDSVINRLKWWDLYNMYYENYENVVAQKNNEQKYILKELPT